jgi:pimeloyl-ACP methyl ester carboxylesterase
VSLSGASDAASLLYDGPWEHSFVSANGARFHVATAGDGPLVLLLHGFPQFWHAWCHQLPALADAGYRAAAVDLRGFGASDKPPKGYDTYTAAADAAAIVRSLGDEQAVIVGHGLGGWTAWAMPTLQPAVTVAVASLGMPHPVVTEHACRHDRRLSSTAKFIARMQVPFRPERTLTRDDREVRGYLTSWSSPRSAFPSEDDVHRYAVATALPFVAHSAAEYFRWFGRNQLRWDGPTLRRRLSAPVTVPALHLHGADDGFLPADATGGSTAYVTGPFHHEVLADAGHFLPEEAPDAVNARLIRWLDGLTDLHSPGITR